MGQFTRLRVLRRDKRRLPRAEAAILLSPSSRWAIIAARMISQIRSVHFVGIGGTAMASAAAMKERGFQVTRSHQNVYPPISTVEAWTQWRSESEG